MLTKVWIHLILLLGLISAPNLGSAFGGNSELDNCIKNPSKCSNEQICSQSLIGERGELAWSYPKHLKEAKRRGLRCVPRSLQKPIVTSPLRTEFLRLKQQERKLIQNNLKRLSLYSSKIDGLWGPGTERAVKAFNKKSFNNVKLTNTGSLRVLKAIINYKFVDKVAELDKLTNKLELSFYGNYVYSGITPKVAYFFAEIQKNDSFELRKLMRNESIDTIVLSSPGGSVYEGLQVAAIINDNALKTYIPEVGVDGEGSCASACSFMFFAGSERVVHGNLGVHQFYSNNKSRDAATSIVEQGTQYTVSEIIGFLNVFNVPPWVYEKMFQQAEMYFFDDDELSKLQYINDAEHQIDYAKINNFIKDFKDGLQKLD